MQAPEIRILIVEDRLTDAELAEHAIRKVLPAPVFLRVETREAFLNAIQVFQPDLIISDYYMPQFDGLTALNITLQLPTFIPLIILTSAINEDVAVMCMKAGAVDYVIKEHIKRLGQAVLHALSEKRLRWERRQAKIALQQSEKRFRSLYENASIGIMRIATDAHILMANPAATRMLGYDSFEDLATHTLREAGFGPTEDFAKLCQGMEQEGGIVGHESLWLRQDGTPIYLRESGQAVRDANGQVLYYDSTLEDITERKRAEERQLQLIEQLRQAQKMESIGLLAGSIAHDFNNLLTVITGYCDLIQDQLAPYDPIRHDIEQLQEAGARAAAMTRQLLAFSRKQIMTPVALDLNMLITNLRKLLDRLIGEDISLVTILPPNLPLVNADPAQIEQVIMNMVVNAREAMPTGGMLTIETNTIELASSDISTHLATPTGLCVMLSVTDNGSGIEPEIQERIFEPFFTTKAAGKGTGLGLSTAYGIIKQSGGIITVYSEPDIGSTFKIYLPVAEQISDYKPPTPVAPLVVGGHETIMLVEDEDIVRKLLRTVLQNHGYTILEARQGDEALALVEQYSGGIDLLITDVVLPNLSGRELSQRLKNIRPELRVLFMSGYTDDTVIRHGLLTNDVAFLPKPFSPSLLVVKVREVLDARRSH